MEPWEGPTDKGEVGDTFPGVSRPEEGQGALMSEPLLPHSWCSNASQDNSLQVMCAPETEAFSWAVVPYGKWDWNKDTEQLNNYFMLTEQHTISYFTHFLLFGVTSCYPWLQQHIFKNEF